MRKLLNKVDRNVFAQLTEMELAEKINSSRYLVEKQLEQGNVKGYNSQIFNTFP